MFWGSSQGLYSLGVMGFRDVQGAGFQELRGAFGRGGPFPKPKRRSSGESQTPPLGKIHTSLL